MIMHASRVTMLLACGALALLPALSPGADLNELAQQAASGEQAAIQALREAGPTGLDALFASKKPLIEQMRSNQASMESAEIAALRQALDTVGAQRDEYASGLYWYTDLKAAKAEARRSGKNILSLRLLGKLTDEYSCANSRFFRTALYSNQAVSQLLKERFVLHWKSVRPVPVITIDMGDGRTLRRTLTGNSIHYVLDQDGRVLDALPGLLGPLAFTKALYATSSIAFYSKLAGQKSHPPTANKLADWHRKQADDLCQEWLLDALQAGAYGPSYQNVPGNELNMPAFLHQAFPDQYPAIRLTVQPRSIKRTFYGPPAIATPPPAMRGAQPLASGNTFPTLKLNPFDPALAPALDADPEEAEAPQVSAIPALSIPTASVGAPTAASSRPVIVARPSATAAAGRAVSKGGPEKPILRRIMPPDEDASTDPQAPGASHSAGTTLIQRMNTNIWSKIAEQHHWDAVLDPASRRLMISKMSPASVSAAELTSGFPASSSGTFGKTLERFQQSMAEDTVRNQYLFHLQIHRWLAKDETGALSGDVDALNKKVYAELFLTPDDDAWLGLMPENTYTALEKEGCVISKGN